MLQLFGDSIASVRGFSLLLSSLTGVLLFSLAKHYSNLVGGLVAWVFFTFSTSHFLFGSEARAYPLFMLEFMLLLWSWIKLQESPRQLFWWVIHTSAALALLYTHYIGTIPLAVSGLISLLFGFNKTFKIRLLASYAVIVLLWLPLLIPAWPVIAHRGENSLHQIPEFSFFKYLLVNVWNGQWAYTLFMSCFLACLPLLFFVEKTQRKQLAYLASMALATYVSLYLGSQWVWFFDENYALFTSLPVLLFFGAFAGKGLKQIPVITTLILLGLLWPFLRNFNPQPKHMLYREVQNSIKTINQLRTANEPVFLFPPFTEFAYLYYANRKAFNSPYHELELALFEDKHFKFENSGEILPRLKDETTFILYLDCYTGTNPIGPLPPGFRVRDSILVPEVYLVLYCETDPNYRPTNTNDK